MHIHKTGAKAGIEVLSREFVTFYGLQGLLVNEIAGIHRTPIVALKAITRISEDQIMFNKLQLPLSGNYREQLKMKPGCVLEQHCAWVISNKRIQQP